MSHSKEIESWIDEAIRMWMAEEIRLRRGASAEEISAAEKQLNFIFPPDFSALYSRVNGFEDYDWNTHMFSLWPLDRILKEYQEEQNKDYIGFCDFLIHSHSVGFCKTGKGIFKSYELEQSIAPDFKQTIAMMQAGDASMY